MPKIEGECTLITTEVTPLSTQKYVPDLRAYCSENFLIISTDLSEGSAETRKILPLNCNFNKPSNWKHNHYKQKTDLQLKMKVKQINHGFFKKEKEKENEEN